MFAKGTLPRPVWSTVPHPCFALCSNSAAQGHLITIVIARILCEHGTEHCAHPHARPCSPTDLSVHGALHCADPHAPNSSMHSVIHQVGDWHCGIPFPRKDTCLPLLSPLFAQGLFPHPVCSTVDTSVRTLVCRTGVGTRRLFWTVRIMVPCGPLSCTLCFALQRQINRICKQV